MFWSDALKGCPSRWFNYAAWATCPAKQKRLRPQPCTRPRLRTQVPSNWRKQFPPAGFCLRPRWQIVPPLTEENREIVRVWQRENPQQCRLFWFLWQPDGELPSCPTIGPQLPPQEIADNAKTHWMQVPLVRISPWLSTWAFQKPVCSKSNNRMWGKRPRVA